MLIFIGSRVWNSNNHSTDLSMSKVVKDFHCLCCTMLRTANDELDRTVIVKFQVVGRSILYFEVGILRLECFMAFISKGGKFPNVGFS